MRLMRLVKLQISIVCSRFPFKHPDDAIDQIDPSSKTASAAPNNIKAYHYLIYYMGGVLLAQAEKADPVTARV